MKYHKDGFIFVAPSKHKLKKYDVYDAKTQNYITSFGALYPDGKPMDQFHDSIGHYSQANTNDPKRRELYDGRHKKEYNMSSFKNKTSAGYFAKHYLW